MNLLNLLNFLKKLFKRQKRGEPMSSSTDQSVETDEVAARIAEPKEETIQIIPEAEPGADTSATGEDIELKGKASSEPPAAEPCIEGDGEPGSASREADVSKDIKPEKIRLLEILLGDLNLMSDDTVDWVQKASNDPVQFQFAFGYSITGESRIIIIRNHAECPENLWFIGDIHGDLLAMRLIIEFIDRTDPNATLVFLGDIIDRHPYSYECLIYLLTLIRKRPGKILWLAGNHDIGLSYNGSGFVSDCVPAEFAEFLNTRSELKDFGIALCKLVRRLPRALFLPDGLLCTHGGVPHEDRLDGLKTEEDLNENETLKDFTWNRIHPKAPKKYVNRQTIGCELGYENVKAFCDKATEILHIPVKRIICGHQHPCVAQKGFERVKSPDIPILVLNSSFFADPVFLDNSRWITPYIAKYRVNDIPEETAVRCDETDVENFYREVPEPATPRPEDESTDAKSDGDGK